MFTAEELQKKIEEFRKMPSETEWLEFKEARNSYSFEGLEKYFSALSNEDGVVKSLGIVMPDQARHDIFGTFYECINC